MLNDELLDAFARQFYGYGNYKGRYWFIGMEEGGGNSEVEAQGRLQAWDFRHQRELEDLAEYHRTIGIDRHFSPSPALQPTWAKLIRLLLSARDQMISADIIRAYQRDNWGHNDGDTCLIELLPLPSPSLDNWIYADCSALPYLSSREKYRDIVAPWRIDHIRQRIAEHQPHAVIFYGLKYRGRWEAIAGTQFETPQNEKLVIAQRENTRYLIVQHPVAVGATNAYFEQAGKLL